MAVRINNKKGDHKILNLCFPLCDKRTREKLKTNKKHKICSRAKNFIEPKAFVSEH